MKQIALMILVLAVSVQQLAVAQPEAGPKNPLFYLLNDSIRTKYPILATIIPESSSGKFGYWGRNLNAGESGTVSPSTATDTVKMPVFIVTSTTKSSIIKNGNGASLVEFEPTGAGNTGIINIYGYGIALWGANINSVNSNLDLRSASTSYAIDLKLGSTVKVGILDYNVGRARFTVGTTAGTGAGKVYADSFYTATDLFVDASRNANFRSLRIGLSNSSTYAKFDSVKVVGDSLRQYFDGGKYVSQKWITGGYDIIVTLLLLGAFFGVWKNRRRHRHYGLYVVSCMLVVAFSVQQVAVGQSHTTQYGNSVWSGDAAKFGMSTIVTLDSAQTNAARMTIYKDSSGTNYLVVKLQNDGTLQLSNGPRFGRITANELTREYLDALYLESEAMAVELAAARQRAKARKEER